MRHFMPTVLVPAIRGYRYADCPLSGGTAKIDRRRSIEGGKGKKKEVPRVVLARALSLPAGRTHVIVVRGSLARHRRPRVALGSRASRRRPRVVAALACGQFFSRAR
ncbi:hypothetical protein GW17_00039438 [Ensete ventricosum]|nr:hypothetical protein GW17_00039438 [Ensete ventricosum]